MNIRLDLNFFMRGLHNLTAIAHSSPFNTFTVSRIVEELRECSAPTTDLSVFRIVDVCERVIPQTSLPVCVAISTTLEQTVLFCSKRPNRGTH